MSSGRGCAGGGGRSRGRTFQCRQVRDGSRRLSPRRRGRTSAQGGGCSLRPGKRPQPGRAESSDPFPGSPRPLLPAPARQVLPDGVGGSCRCRSEQRAPCRLWAELSSAAPGAAAGFLPVPLCHRGTQRAPSPWWSSGHCVEGLGNPGPVDTPGEQQLGAQGRVAAPRHPMLPFLPLVCGEQAGQPGLCSSALSPTKQ